MIIPIIKNKLVMLIFLLNIENLPCKHSNKNLNIVSKNICKKFY